MSTSIRMERLGGRALHSGDNDDTEREYDRLRDLARAEADKRNKCYHDSHEAYQNGDGARAKELSNQGKQHDAKMDEYNQQASEYIFRANNAPGRVEPDCIDLHGQFVEEAEKILEQRIREDQRRGQTHLHAIVGKGNHSANHVQKIKPKVEELCRELGLKYRTEDNAGRIYINLQGGEPLGPGDVPSGGYGGGGYSQQQQQHQQPHYQQQQQHQQYPHHQQSQQQQQQDEIEQMVEKELPKVLRFLQKNCCVVM